MANDAAAPMPSAEDFVEFIRDRVRDEAILHFHRDWLFAPIPPRLQHPNQARLRQIVAEAVRNIQDRCPALALEAKDNLYGFYLQPSAKGEWAEIQQFAFGEGYRNDTLSPAAAALLERVESGELGTFCSELSVRHRIQCFGSCRPATLVAEIKLKKGITIEVEESGESYPQRKHMLRFRMGARIEPGKCPPALNPVLSNFNESKTGLPGPIEFRQWLWKLLLDTKPIGATQLDLWAFSTRAEIYRCFPGLQRKPELPNSAIVSLLQSIRGHNALGVVWNFSANEPFWMVSLKPQATWEATLSELAAELQRPTPEKQFGLTAAAAILYDWLQRQQALEWGLTPIIENEIRGKRLLLDCPWANDNLGLWIEILCDEISMKTPLKACAVSWKEYHTDYIRIKLTRPAAAP
jgi:hypothetical protein